MIEMGDLGLHIESISEDKACLVTTVQFQPANSTKSIFTWCRVRTRDVVSSTRAGLSGYVSATTRKQIDGRTLFTR